MRFCIRRVRLALTITHTCSNFRRESAEAIRKRRDLGRRPLADKRMLLASPLKHNESEQEQPAARPRVRDCNKHWRAWEVQHLAHPVRPPWDKRMRRSDLEASEESYFYGWLEALYTKHPGALDLCHFEHNLEVWRQLWRVMERVQVLCIVADARMPLLHIPVPLIRQAHRLGLPVVVVLNKADLIPEEVCKSAHSNMPLLLFPFDMPLLLFLHQPNPTSSCFEPPLANTHTHTHTHTLFVPFSSHLSFPLSSPLDRSCSSGSYI
jgi:hypothetical protein